MVSSRRAARLALQDKMIAEQRGMSSVVMIEGIEFDVDDGTTARQVALYLAARITAAAGNLPAKPKAQPKVGAGGKRKA